MITLPPASASASLRSSAGSREGLKCSLGGEWVMSMNSIGLSPHSLPLHPPLGAEALELLSSPPTVGTLANDAVDALGTLLRGRLVLIGGR